MKRSIQRIGKLRRFFGARTGTALAFACALNLFGPALEAQGQVMVIAHPSVPADSLEKAELLRLFTGDTESWADGAPVVVMDLAEKGAIRDAFYAFLGKTSSRMRSIWLKRKLTGEGELPESIESEEELAGKVASTEGAIGFVSAATAAGRPDVKVLIDSIPLTHQPVTQP